MHPQPPKATKKPHVLEDHGLHRQDDYYWMRDRENQAVIDYLNAENAYMEAVLEPEKEMRQKLYDEVVGRIPQHDETVPFRLEGYWYSIKYSEGMEYAQLYRREDREDAAEELMLDCNLLAEGQPYFDLAGATVDNQSGTLAFATDTVGRRIYDVHFKDLATGKISETVIKNTTGHIAWSTDHKTLIYTRQNEETLRPYQVYAHEVGTDPANDKLIFQEDDQLYSVMIERSRSRKYLFIMLHSHSAMEYRILPADNPFAEARVVTPRRENHRYYLDHYGDHFYILSDDEALNFKIMKTRVDQLEEEHWQEVVAHREDVLLDDFHINAHFLVWVEYIKGLPKIMLRHWATEETHELDFEETAYDASLGMNPDFDTPLLRFNYQSMTTPASVYDYDMVKRKKILRKEREVIGDFSHENYFTERIEIEVRDQTLVPVSLVYRKGTPLDGSAPLMLYAYGSYGIKSEPTFSYSRLSLLDRGFIFAIAHIRGGADMGRGWYEDGKLLKKWNTFNDYIDCAAGLIERKYTTAEGLCGFGGSAGGMLMGVAINQRPDLFKAVIAAVPFVDCTTTMLDASIPLTTQEYVEWGNPEEKQYFDYIHSYAPYDQVKAQDYPHLLVTSGLHDSQVQYWEPTKWVAKLRELKTDDNLLLLYTNMDAGHSGQSGRFRKFYDVALEYAFLFKVLGISL
jgi:oligopeptidase B